MHRLRKGGLRAGVAWHSHTRKRSPFFERSTGFVAFAGTEPVESGTHCRATPEAGVPGPQGLLERPIQHGEGARTHRRSRVQAHTIPCGRPTPRVPRISLITLHRTRRNAFDCGPPQPARQDSRVGLDPAIHAVGARVCQQQVAHAVVRGLSSRRTCALLLRRREWPAHGGQVGNHDRPDMRRQRSGPRQTRCSGVWCCQCMRSAAPSGFDELEERARGRTVVETYLRRGWQTASRDPSRVWSPKGFRD
jgi:hypothetical protein